MRHQQAAGAAVGGSAGEYGGVLRRIAHLVASIWSWSILGLTTLVFYSAMWIGSLVVGRRRSFRRLLHTWAWLTLKLAFFKIDVDGLDRVPRPSVLAANHQHYFDIILLAAILPPPFVFVARVEVLKVPIVGSVLKRGRHILVKRGALAENEPMVDEAVRCLGEGAHVIFFPEGTRSRDGRVRAFKSGAFRVAAAAGRPLAPVTLAGSRAPIPGGSITNLPSRLRVSFHEAREITAADARSETLRTTVRDAVAERLESMNPHTGPRL
jgi:1-acyl-sn-glycerol-3-phosphate acyltransferase